MTRRNRRPRPKARKPKYLSLRRYLAPPPPPPLADAETPSPPPPPPPPPEERSASSCCDVSSSSAAAPLSGSGAHDDNGKEPQLLEITPLQPPDHLDRDPHVASLLLLDDDNRTLEALFGDDGSAAASSGSPSPASAADSPASSSMNWDGLARRALRGRERWVYCHSSSSSLPAVSSSGDEEASSARARSGSRAADLWWRFAGTDQSKAQALTLKLDYEEILAAWSDRGPLYIEAEAPQVVPQLHGEPYYAFPVMVEVGPSEAWRVPEFAGAPAASESQRTAGGKGEAEGELEEGEEKRSREERVRRYKEKRRSRLFAKRIRYEVRKLNAEKRPRFKGRFVKRKDEMEGLALSPYNER